MKRRWKDHKKDFKDCSSCPLHEFRRRIVLAKGKVPADIVFIGEAPSMSDDALGTPFSGPAGILLDQIVEDVVSQSDDFTELRMAYTNLLGCIPREGRGQGKVKQPAKEHIQACYPRLQDFIDLCNPKLIVCVGKIVEKTVSTLFIEHEAITITHPAVILRADVARKDYMIHQTVVELADELEIKFGRP